MKSALFTGSEFFSTCEKPVKNHVKILVSHVFSEVNSHVSHRKFTGFYPIVDLLTTFSLFFGVGNKFYVPFCNFSCVANKTSKKKKKKRI